MKLIRWKVETKDKIESMLISYWGMWGIGIPKNYESIVQWCYEFICEDDFNDELDPIAVRRAFKHWIESQK